MNEIIKGTYKLVKGEEKMGNVLSFAEIMGTAFSFT
jgi:hypothetical protein